MRKISNILLCLALGFSLIGNVVPVYANDNNLALNKPISVSGVEGGYKEDGSLTYPHLAPSHLNDGNVSSRWSSNMALNEMDLNNAPDQNVWAVIDLQKEVNIGKIVMKWQAANSRNYDVQVSLDGNEWKVLQHYEDLDSVGRDYTETLTVENGIKARYVRIYARLGTYVGDYKCPSISLYEIEVYEYSVESILEKNLNEALSLDVSMNDEMTRLILPSLKDDVSLNVYATSNAAVVDTNQQITLPYEDMKVNLFYEVCSVDGSCLKSDVPKKIVIPGQYEHSKEDNPKPDVVPKIREWKGYKGTTAYNGVLVIESEALRESANQIAMYFKEMVGIESTIQVGRPSNGNIYLKLDHQSVLGEEGYTLDISDYITVTAKTPKGILYGGTTISQMLTLSEDHQSLPKGIARDYPQYPIRSVMLDVARQYIPLDYLTEITRYAGYFKLSEFRNHINDNGGEQASAFRIESKKYPQLNEGIQVYSQKDYKLYQKDAKKYGVDVVTEIDTPAHAGAFAKIDSSLLMDGYHLDLRTEEAYQKAMKIMKDVFDEFLDGDDPVFQNGKFHIGTDEYDKSYSEILRRYIDELIKYVNEKNYEVRFWASLGTNGFSGTTPVSNKAIAHLWANSWASFDEMKEDGYKFINNNDGLLYTVPFAGYYNDYLNIKNLYNNWEVSNLTGGNTLEAGHPQLLGAEASLWYDMKVGASEFDIFDRFKDQIVLIAEKTWYGEKDNQNGDQFIQRVHKVNQRTPQSNPARYVESDGQLVVSYDFNQCTDQTVQDLSKNDYDGTIVDTYCLNDALFLNGKGYIHLPLQSIGYPYTVEFDIKIDKATPANSLIFEGKDGKLFYNYDGTGLIGYERKGYSYVIDATIPVGVKTHFAFTCDEKDLRFYINGIFVGSGEYYKVTGASKQGSSTFVLPLEKIGRGIYGSLDNLKIYNYKKSSSEMSGSGNNEQENENIAFKKQVMVSGVEGGYKEDGTLVYPQFDPQNATDGDSSTKISLNRDHDAWLSVDLGKSYLIDHVLIKFRELPNAYQIQVSEDNQTWKTVSEKRGINGGASSEEILTFDSIVKARYVKYQQLEMFEYDGNGSYYSGNFTELEVYGYEIDKYVKAIEEARDVLSKYEITDQNREFISDIQTNIEKLESMLEKGPIDEMELIHGMISQQLSMLEKNEIPEKLDKTELKKLIDEKLNVDEYSAETWNRYQQAILFGQGVFYNVNTNQQSIDYACKMIQDAKENLKMKDYITISSNKKVYVAADTNHAYDLKYLIDGEQDSLTWLQGNQKIGDYVLFEFRDVQTFNQIDIYSNHGGSDIIHSGKVEVSENGKDWKAVAEIGGKEAENIVLDHVKAKFVRISVTADHPTWWKLSEVVFNGKQIQDKEVLKSEIEWTMDAALYTKESVEQYKKAVEDGKLVYENEQAKQYEIDEAVLNIRTARSKLVNVLDKRELKAFLDKKVDPAPYTIASYKRYEEVYQMAKGIYDQENVTQQEVDEAVFKLVEVTQLLQEVADYRLVDMRIEEAKKLNKNQYKDFNQVSQAIQAVVRDLDISKQEEVDKMAEAIKTAMEQLEYKGADYSAVDQAIAEAKKLKKDDYKDFSAVEKAMNNVVRDKNITQQAEVDAMAKAITDAISKLEKKVDTNNPDVPVKPIQPTDPDQSIKPTPEVPDNENKPGKEDGAVNTSDSNQIMMWMMLTVLAGVGFVTFLFKKRKSEKN